MKQKFSLGLVALLGLLVLALSGCNECDDGRDALAKLNILHRVLRQNVAQPQRINETCDRYQSYFDKNLIEATSFAKSAAKNVFTYEGTCAPGEAGHIRRECDTYDNSRRGHVSCEKIVTCTHVADGYNQSIALIRELNQVRGDLAGGCLYQNPTTVLAYFGAAKAHTEQARINAEYVLERAGCNRKGH